MNNKVWLIGCGLMAKEYAKVLNDIGLDYDVIGRGEKNAIEFEKLIGKKVIKGGIEKNFSNLPTPTHVINVVSMESLFSTMQFLIKKGIKNILGE